MTTAPTKTAPPRLIRPFSRRKALARFLAGLGSRQQPVLLDLGPVVGANVTFFGEEVGCKIFVEDLSKDIDRHVHQAKLEELPAFFDKRFPQEAESIDGILCWDIFDYPGARLGRAARAAARRACCAPTACCSRFSARLTRDRKPGRQPTPATSSSIARTCSTGRTQRRAASSGRC